MGTELGSPGSAGCGGVGQRALALRSGLSKLLLSSGTIQARGKKRPAPVQNSDGDEEEDSEEDDAVTQGDLWGSEDSSEDMVDDYGADSSSEAEEKVRRFWYSQGDLSVIGATVLLCSSGCP